MWLLLWTSRDILLQRVRHQREHFLLLIQQEHNPQISEAFVSEARASHEFETFHLAEMGLGTKHVYVEEFGNIVVSCVRVFFTKGGTDGSRLLLDQGAFVRDGLLGWDWHRTWMRERDY